MKPYFIDLHCDLLMSLGAPDPRTDQDSAIRCSYPQLKQGRVALQTLALFTTTSVGSHQTFLRQLEAYQRLDPLRWQPFDKATQKQQGDSSVKTILAIENASGLLEEHESLELLEKRLTECIDRYGSFLYITLTWNEQNRFGGGNATDVGLKEDGKHLLELMAEHHIAVDFSHTSDRFAREMINYIDRKNLQLPLLASHSNFRAIQEHPRNLPDDIAKEIFKRRGVVGINFIARFVGKPFENQLLAHINHGIKLGGAKQLCFGADFFCDSDTPSSLNDLRPFFDNQFADASCYPRLAQLIEERLGSEFTHDISYKNFETSVICSTWPGYSLQTLAAPKLT